MSRIRTNGIPGALDRALSKRKQNGGLVDSDSDSSSGSADASDRSSRDAPHTSPDSQISTPTSAIAAAFAADRRRPSNPLAPAFIVSAPGKTIVYGEHAVVHGKPAIAATISLRSYLHVSTLTKSHRTVSLRFGDIGLDHTWSIPDLPWQAFSHPARKRKYYDLVTSLDQDLVTAMQPYLTDVSPREAPEMRKIHLNAASAFLYLFLSLGNPNSPPCIYSLRSTIPIAAGLGSSASVSVCLSTALLIQSRALSGPHPDQQSEEAEKQLERINRWAFVGELLIHGNPSGVDNTVATHGHAVLFQRTDYAKPPAVTIMREFPELPLLLIHTGQSRSTAHEVAKVQRFRDGYPSVADPVLDAIEGIVRSVYASITEPNFDPHREDCIAFLGDLIAVNHNLLAALGVSHPRLERLRFLVDRSGVGWTKLTGAGGGGCAITLLKPNLAARTAPPSERSSSQQNGRGDAQQHSAAAPELEPTSFVALEQALKEEGFTTYETTLGGDGVGVLYPAVINGEEIDLATFSTAETREDVEALVGGKRDREAWKYWRP